MIEAIEIGAPQNWQDSRFEVKAPVYNRPLSEILAAIKRHPFGFSECYPKRVVNSIYFDTPGLVCFRTSEEGINNRCKLRLRWYGSDEQTISSANLEWKMSHSQFKLKRMSAIPLQGTLGELNWRRLRQDIKKQLNDQQMLFFEAYNRPVVMVSYERLYFLSLDGICRVTLDNAIHYTQQTTKLRPQFRGGRMKHGLRILELKASRQHRADVESCLQYLPYRPARFSKYASAVGQMRL